MLRNKKIIIAVAICAVVVAGTGAGIALANHFSGVNNSLLVPNSKEANSEVTTANNEVNTAGAKDNNATADSKSEKSNDSKEAKTSTVAVKSSEAKKSTSSKKSTGTTKSTAAKSTGLKQKYLSELASVTKEEEQIYYDLKHPKEGEPLTEGNAYSLWDNELNKVYGIVKNNISKSEFAKLQKSELAWIKDKESGNKGITELAKVSKDRCYYIVNNYMPE